MLSTSTPADAGRLAALRSYDLLDTEPDESLDRLVARASAVFGVSAAAVTLVDAERQWFKARYGIALAETGLAESLCAIALQEVEGLLVIADAPADPRFATHAAVTGRLQVGFYAGAALETPGGDRIGTLCVFDPSPRHPTEAQLLALRLLAGEAVARFELHRERQRRLEVEQRLAEAQRLAEVGSWELDVASGRLWWSEEVFRQFGLEPTAFGATYEAFRRTVHPEDRALMDTAQARVLAGEAPLDLSHRIVRPDGVERIVHERGELLRDRQGTPRRLVGTVQDITSRAAADAWLRESESRWRELFQSAPRPMWVYERDTLRFLAVNDAAVATYGWTREEFLSMDLRAIRPADDVKWLERSIEFEDRGFNRAGIWRHLWKNGEEREVEITSHDVHWEGQRARLVLADDVTDRERAQRQLIALNKQLGAQAALLDLANDAIVVHDIGGRVSFWNGGATRIFGWTRDEAIGQEVRLVFGIAADAHAVGMDAVLANGAWRGELQGITRDHGPLTLEISKTLVHDADGGPSAVLSIVTDVTEERRLEAQFLRAQRLESIGTLAAGIAHDLNNMLTPIVMSIELLQEEMHTEHAREMMHTIETSAQRGADLVRQVLSFARGVEGKRVPVALADVVQDIERLLLDTMPRSLTLEFDVPADLPPVLGDPTQLHQVLLNLCVNARDAMPDGGLLRVVAALVTPDAQYAIMVPGGIEGPFVRLDVADTGSGIAPGDLDRIFDPFFTTKPVGQGTGLGLATVQAITRSHGGFVNVYSEEGKGTTFRVYLPVVAGATIDRPENAATRILPRGMGELVLVVDDEAAIRAITRQTLEAFGYRVLLAADGVEALEQIDRHPGVTLVLTDMMMPRLDGPGLIRELARVAPDVPIIAASGLGSNGGVAKAAGLGVTHFLAKPYTAETLLRTIAVIVAQRR